MFWVIAQVTFFFTLSVLLVYTFYDILNVLSHFVQYFRWPLEAAGVLEPWQSVLDGDFEKQDEKEEEEQPALEDETHEKVGS